MGIHGILFGMVLGGLTPAGPGERGGVLRVVVREAGNPGLFRMEVPLDVFARLSRTAKEGDWTYSTQRGQTIPLPLSRVRKAVEALARTEGRTEGKHPILAIKEKQDNVEFYVDFGRGEGLDAQRRPSRLLLVSKEKDGEEERITLPLAALDLFGKGFLRMGSGGQESRELGGLLFGSAKTARELGVGLLLRLQDEEGELLELYLQ